MTLLSGAVIVMALTGAAFVSLSAAAVAEKKLNRPPLDKLALYALIALGSGIGGVARAFCAEAATRLFGQDFPWGILMINALGSFVIGYFFAATGPDGRWLVRSTTRQFVMTGICGGYTTFSSFSLDTLNLLRDGRLGAAGANVGLSLVACLLFVWLGFALASELNRTRAV